MGVMLLRLRLWGYSVLGVRTVEPQLPLMICRPCNASFSRNKNKIENLTSYKFVPSYVTHCETCYSRCYGCSNEAKNRVFFTFRLRLLKNLT